MSHWNNYHKSLIFFLFRFICAQGWSDATSNKICKYLGYLSTNSHKLVRNSVYPHLAVGELPQDSGEHQMYKRQAIVS